MNSFRSALKRHPVVAFYVLAFVLSWLGWVPQGLHARGLLSAELPVLNLLGGGPTLAAVIVTWASKGKDRVHTLFAPLFKMQARAGWFFSAFGLWFVVAGLALGIVAVFGQTLPGLGRFPWVSLLPIFIAMLLSNVWEEIGRRGFALPRLQKRYGDLAIVFIMGLLWELWHWPLYLDPTNPMSNLNLGLSLLFSLALLIVLVHGTHRFRRSSQATSG